jgi:hypothetical protein
MKESFESNGSGVGLSKFYNKAFPSSWSHSNPDNRHGFKHPISDGGFHQLV